MTLFNFNKKNNQNKNRFKPQLEGSEVTNKSDKMSSGKLSDRGKHLKKAAKPVKYIRQILDGTILENKKVVKNMPFILFISLIGIIYITNSTNAESKRRELAILNEELKELRYRYISTKASVMYYSNQSQISKRLENTGIKESTVSPVKIFISEKNKKTIK